MALLIIFFILAIAGCLFLPFITLKAKGYVAFVLILANSIIISFVAVNVMLGEPFLFTFNAGFPYGEIPLRIDYLSAFFILVINLTLVTGSLYGKYYLNYSSGNTNLSIHFCFLLVLQASMNAVCIVQHAIVFIMFWELMTASAFFLVIFEHENKQTLRAGLNYFIQSHLGVLMLIIGFIMASHSSGSYDFAEISFFAAQHHELTGVWPFLVISSGFAYKAGFIPMHTWLPYAHPAAPSHVSGIMSGVILKMGIYGIFRSLFFFAGDFISLGYFILFISTASALYGVMLAVIQHNIKKLLAYHSIENIGIIGMGIGIGVIGMGKHDPLFVFLGFSGALLHTLNHSLFKSLLFYTAGSVYRKIHTLSIDEMGGLARQMPHTAFFFLAGAIAISGLPPLNGFISEFLIYFALFTGIFDGSFTINIFYICCASILALVGGLAFLCFTKAFGVVFLGNPRRPREPVTEVEKGMLVPQYLVLLFMISISVYPEFWLLLLSKPVSLYIQDIRSLYPELERISSLMRSISVASILLIAFSAAIYIIKKIIVRKRVSRLDETWSCGYSDTSPQMQYTAASFVKTYSEIASPVLKIKTEAAPLKGVFPGKSAFHTTTRDKLEFFLIDLPLRAGERFFNAFAFLQNGRVQYYILYGLLFIVTVLFFTFANDLLLMITGFFSHV